MPPRHVAQCRHAAQCRPAGKGGIFSRDIIGVRIEDVPADSVWAMHHFYKSCAHQFSAHAGSEPQFWITGRSVRFGPG